MTLHSDNLASWKWTREKIRKGDPDHFYCCQSICRGNPGTYVSSFVSVYHPAPLGSLWFSFHANQTEIDILNVYVMDPVRRCGIARKIVQDLFEKYPHVQVITSDAGSPLGEKWMNALKFKRIVGKRWELHRGKK